MTITGTKQDDKKFEKLKKERWKKLGLNGRVTYCKVHETHFNEEEEPCWQCYDECQEDDSTCEFYPLPGGDCVCRAGSDVSGLFVCTKDYSEKCQRANDRRSEVML